MADSSTDFKSAFDGVKARDPHQEEFLEAAEEVLSSLKPLFDKYPKYLKVIPVVSEPERVIQFRVPWQADDGSWQVNRGFRVQFNQALGPYKGGLRFHPSVNLSIIKFLGFEQIFKNALTGLPMGGGKGGSDFDPKGKSDGEVLRFCQSFMTELSRHIGADTDVPAGDIGVGGREIGYLFGQWKRLTRLHVGVLTGKGMSYSGSNIRPEATGYGLVYITQIALNAIGKDLKGMRVAISGSGNVAEFATEKCLQLGATVISLSDSGGAVVEESGFTEEQFAKIREIKARRGRIKEYVDFSKTAKFYAKDRPWKHVGKVDVVLPSATQNEINEEEALALVKAGAKFVAEGANMPSDPNAIAVFKKHCTFFIPAKAANAGGVAVSGLEMSQNSMRTTWSREEVDKKLFEIMRNIYTNISTTAADLGCDGDFQLGANAAGFKLVADSMFDQGMVM
jgi:glutamate dehydrogenase/leucine dehydrogenase